MGRRLFGTYLLAGVSALVLYVVLPSRDAREFVWQAFIWGAVASMLLGIRVHRPSWRRPWLVTAFGLALLALAGTINLPWLPADSAELRRLVGDGLSLVGYPMIGVGSAAFARAQSGGRDRGPVLDSLIVTVALTTVLWEGVFARHGGSVMEPASLAALLVVSLSASWVAAMTTRLILAGGHRAPSGWLLFASSVGGMSGASAFVWAGHQGRLIQGEPIDLLWGVSVLLVGAAAVHPTMGVLTRPAPSIDAANTWARTVLPALALAAPPLAVLVRQVTTGETATVAAGASILIAVVVVFRFTDLVRSRERSRHDSHRRATREGALARLGEQGLAGEALPDLLVAAQEVLAPEIGGLCLLEVVVSEDDPGPRLPGSGGRIRLVTSSPLALTPDTETFVTAVGHVLGAAVARHRDEEELRYQSLHDPLTRLANRTLLEDRIVVGLGRRREPGRTLAVVFIDLDGFKEINDTLGHAVGDDVLRRVAARLSATVRSADTVGRFAGDEFVLVLDDVDGASATRLADRLLARLRERITLGGRTLHVTGSAGLALASADMSDSDDLLRLADQAMYRAKQSGGDRLEVVDAREGASGVAREGASGVAREGASGVAREGATGSAHGGPLRSGGERV